MSPRGASKVGGYSVIKCQEYSGILLKVFVSVMVWDIVLDIIMDIVTYPKVDLYQDLHMILNPLVDFFWKVEIV